jgi:hypothetical protein
MMPTVLMLMPSGSQSHPSGSIRGAEARESHSAVRLYLFGLLCLKRLKAARLYQDAVNEGGDSLVLHSHGEIWVPDN